MLEAGKIDIDYDTDFIKAVTTRQLMDTAWMLHNQEWHVFENDTPHPFITSDNPVAFDPPPRLGQPPTRFVTVTPRLGLLIRVTNLTVPVDLSKPPLGKIIHRRCTDFGAHYLNRLVARCAEELVFSNTEASGVASVVRNAAPYRVEVDHVSFPAAEPGAYWHGPIIRLRKRTS